MNAVQLEMDALRTAGDVCRDVLEQLDYAVALAQIRAGMRGPDGYEAFKRLYIRRKWWVRCQALHEWLDHTPEGLRCREVLLELAAHYQRRLTASDCHYWLIGFGYYVWRRKQGW